MYLCIRNLGVADYRSFTLIGASTSRANSETIGQFGSGSKYSIALLLRNNLSPVITAGNLKMEFATKSERVKDQTFNRINIKFSGCDAEGTKNYTENLGFCLEWGEQDWNNLGMAIREFVANALDACVEQNLPFSDVEVEIVEKPRAKRGTTAVFIPLTSEIHDHYDDLDEKFLHFNKKELLSKKLLPKIHHDNKIRVYKKGVLVSLLDGNSVYDYNLGDELTLDESRNASETDVRYAVAKALKNSPAKDLIPVLHGISDRWEGELDSYDLRGYENSSAAKEFQVAWKVAYGDKAVATRDNNYSSECLRQKGFDPIVLPDNWLTVLESYGVPSESKVLSRNEVEGKIVSEPTEEMIAVVNRVWNLFESYNLTNGKTCPKVMGFTSIMSAGSQTFGYYLLGESTVYLHTSLGGKQLFKVTLEEVLHYITQARDGSRDLQDALFNLITEMSV